VGRERGGKSRGREGRRGMGRGLIRASIRSPYTFLRIYAHSHSSSALQTGGNATSVAERYYYYYYFFIPLVVKIPGVKRKKLKTDVSSLEWSEV